MTPELSRRLAAILGRHIVSPDERRTIIDAAQNIDKWDELPAEIRELLQRIEGGTGTQTINPQQRDRTLQLATRAAGHDVTPGHDQLHHYWTLSPAGRARWVKSPKPWTTLLENLQEEVHDKPIEVLKKWASRWYIEVFGYAANSDQARIAHGKPPRGKRVGPG